MFFPNDNPHAIPLQIGNSISPLPVRDLGTEKDAAKVSTDY